VRILAEEGVDYDAHNVLADDELRQGIKDYTYGLLLVVLYAVVVVVVVVLTVCVFESI
jgi:glutaredoxin-related protein